MTHAYMDEKAVGYPALSFSLLFSQTRSLTELILNARLAVSTPQGSSCLCTPLSPQNTGVKTLQGCAQLFYKCAKHLNSGPYALEQQAFSTTEPTSKSAFLDF